MITSGLGAASAWKTSSRRARARRPRSHSRIGKSKTRGCTPTPSPRARLRTRRAHPARIRRRRCSHRCSRRRRAWRRASWRRAGLRETRTSPLASRCSPRWSCNADPPRSRRTGCSSAPSRTGPAPYERAARRSRSRSSRWSRRSARRRSRTRWPRAPSSRGAPLVGRGRAGRRSLWLPRVSRSAESDVRLPIAQRPDAGSRPFTRL